MRDVDPGEVDAWLRLSTTPRVGRAAARRFRACRMYGRTMTSTITTAIPITTGCRSQDHSSSE
jgi:hypothetical protein